MKWIDFVKAYRQQHPQKSYRQCLTDAAPHYKKAKELVGGGIIDDIKAYIWKHLNPVKPLVDFVQSRRKPGW